MKKTMLILTSLLLICIIFFGCNTTDATISTSKELNKNLNLLSTTVKKLDTIDNEYLVGNELYSLSEINNSNQYKTEPLKLANSDNVVLLDSNSGLSDNLQEKIKDEIISRLYCTEDGNCTICDEKFICDNNGVCTNCNKTIICDKYGNCKTCENKLVLNEESCSNCSTNCITDSQKCQANESTILELQKISLNNTSQENEESSLLFTDYSNTDINDKKDNINYNNDNINKVIANTSIINTTNNADNYNTTNDIDTELSPDTNAEIDSQLDKNPEPNIDNIKFYYYSEERFNPELLRYKPRFINNINFMSANSNLENYVEKLQKLYTMTADVVEANNTLANYKILILNDIDETKELNNCIISGTCTPNNNQIQALNNYIDDIKITIDNLRKCNGNLTSEINKISSRNTGISHNIEVTNSNYLRILNQIDTRISYHENAIATLDQIKYLLQDAQGNTNNNIEVEDLNDNNIIVLPDNQIDESNKNSNAIDNEPDSLNNENEITTDTPDNQPNNTISENETNNSPIQEDNNFNDEYELDNDIDSERDDITEDNSDMDNNISYDEAGESTDNVNNEEIIENDTIESNAHDDIINIDTYDDNVSNLETNSTTTSNEEEINDTIITNSNNNTMNSSKPNTPQMVDGDSYVNTNQATSSFNNNFNSTTPNTIISQNNINGNDLGNNSYRYDDDGNLFNNTNGYNNANLNNINNNNNNINTYEYNTLIDSINRGTVNNGINNL